MAGSICVHAVHSASSWQSLQSLCGKPDFTGSEGSCETLALEEALASSWDPEKSAQLYAVDGWGSPYLFVSLDGHLMVRPHGGKIFCSRWNKGVECELGWPLVRRVECTVQWDLHAFCDSVSTSDFRARWISVHVPDLMDGWRRL